MPNILDEVAARYPVVTKSAVRASQYLVRSFVSRYGLDQDDLLQEAAFELVKCVSSYDSSRGSDFTGYAQVAVRNRMIKCLDSSRRIFENSLGPGNLFSLDQVIDEWRSLYDVLPESRYSSLERKESDLLISQLVSCLSSPYREVFCGYNGIGVKCPATIAEMNLHNNHGEGWADMIYRQARSAMRPLIAISGQNPLYLSSFSDRDIGNLYICSDIKKNVLARLCNVHRNTIGNRFKKIGIKDKGHRKRHGVVWPSRKELRSLAASSTPIQVARKYGVSATSVQRWARSYGLSFPSARAPRGAYLSWDFRKAQMERAVSEKGLDVRNLTKGSMRRAGVEPVLHWYRRNRAKDFKDAIVKLVEDLYPDYAASYISRENLMQNEALSKLPT